MYYQFDDWPRVTFTLGSALYCFSVLLYWLFGSMVSSYTFTVYDYCIIASAVRHRMYAYSGLTHTFNLTICFAVVWYSGVLCLRSYYQNVSLLCCFIRVIVQVPSADDILGFRSSNANNYNTYVFFCVPIKSHTRWMMRSPRADHTNTFAFHPSPWQKSFLLSQWASALDHEEA